MANSKQAVKRWRQSLKRRLRNRAVHSRTRTLIGRAQRLLATGDTEQSPTAVREAVRALDKAAEKGILHRNNVARRKSRLMLRLNRVHQERTAAADAPAAPPTRARSRSRSR